MNLPQGETAIYIRSMLRCGGIAKPDQFAAERRDLQTVRLDGPIRIAPR